MKPFPNSSRPLVPAAVALAVSLSALPAHAAEPPAPLTPEIRTEVIESLSQLLEDLYVIPETAARLKELTHARLADGAYDALDTEAFAAQLTEDLQGLSGDRHLRVMFGEQLTPMTVIRGGPGEGEGGPKRIIVGGPGGKPGGPGPKRIIRTPGEEGERKVIVKPGEGTDGGVFEGRTGIHDAEILPGNIGLVKVDLFVPLAIERDAAVRAMETVADTDALIFDLRACSGGTPEMVHFITSYLFPPAPKHLLTYYHGHAAPDSAYTMNVPGPRMPDVPVFVLTSPFTASGGEEFTYGLKHHGRATVVGEKTAGGGHGGGVHPVAAGFHAFVPDFRPVHPATGGGWEGVGVIPDRACAAGQAALVARTEALRRLAEDAGGARGAELDALHAELEAEIAQMTAAFDPAAHAEYAGSYGIRTIFVEDDGLYLQRTGGPRLRLVAADAPDEFALERVPQAKIRFARDADGAIEALHVRNMQGEWEVTERE